MKIAYHGNYCGPGWTGGKYIDNKDVTEADFVKPPIDSFDGKCKQHDYEIMLAYRLTGEERDKALKNADDKFIKSIENDNIPGAVDDVASLLVWAGGPGPKLRRNYDKPDDITVMDVENDLHTTPPNKRQRTEPTLTVERSNEKRQKSEEDVWESQYKEAEQSFIEFATDLAGNIDQQYLEDVKDTEYIYDNDKRLIEYESDDGPVYKKRKINNNEQEDEDIINTLLNMHSFSNMSDTTQVNTNESGSELKKARTMENTQIAAKETPISIPLRIERSLFQETVTVSLPITFYVSMNRLNQVTPVNLFVRLNHPHLILKDNVLIGQFVPNNTANFDGRNFGLSNDQATFDVFTAVGTGNSMLKTVKQPWENFKALSPFPTTIKGLTAATNNRILTYANSSYGNIDHDYIRPKNLAYFCALYQYMTTLQTKYKITMINTQQDDARAELVFIKSNDSYGVEGRGTGTFPNTLPLNTALHQTNVSKFTVDPIDLRSGHNKEFTIVSDVWTPTSFKRDVKNDGDDKTWTATIPQILSNYTDTGYLTSQATTQAKNPDYYEGVGLHGYSRELSATRQPCINLKVEIDYICQFKDLRIEARYPVSANPSNEKKQILLSTRQIHQLPRSEDVERIGPLLTSGYSSYNPVP